jgi:hypothetical protein
VSPKEKSSAIETLSFFEKGENKMKRNFLSIGMLLLVIAAVTGAANKTLTEDPLTGLPVVPSPDRLHLGNEPVVLPETQVCKSKALMNFYRPNGIQVNSTVTWYASRLQGFKKTHAWANSRTQDTFYKSDGTAIVSITGDPGPDGQDAEVYGIVYGKFTPGISEKTIVGMNMQKIVCP